MDHSVKHPSHEFLVEVANKALTMEEINHSFPALWQHLQECDECMVAIVELMRLAHGEGHQEGHAEETAMRRMVVLVAMTGIVAMALLAGGFIVWRGRSEAATVNRVYRRVAPAVANIVVESAGKTGSGVVFDKAGHVLTNYHVVNNAKGDEDIRVQLPGLGQVPATLVGHDLATDLAILRVDAPPGGLTVANFGNSDAVEVGDLAIAIGNPFGLSQTLTVGHISAVKRQLMSNDMYAPPIEGVIQTDASINPGNSGGPLLNAAGEVIGINTRIESPLGGSVGIGFAVPSSTAMKVAREIIEHGYVSRPFLGAGGRPLDERLAQDLNLPVHQGLLVQEIHSGSPADQIGLRPGGETVQTSYGPVKAGADVILAVNGQPVRNQADLNQLIVGHKVGETIQLEVLRAGQRITLEATLAERPHDRRVANK